MTHAYGLQTPDKRDREIQIYRAALQEILKLDDVGYSSFGVATKALDDGAVLSVDDDYSIRDARIKAGLSQDNMAEAMGVTRVTISYWEKLEKQGKLKEHIRLAVWGYFEKNKER